MVYVFFCKQKTAYEMRISDWSSDVCSSDLCRRREASQDCLEGCEPRGSAPCRSRPCRSMRRRFVRLIPRTNAMNAVSSSLLQQTEQLSESVTRTVPGSRKTHVEGSRPDIRVAMREITLSQTPTLFGGEANPPEIGRAPSGPYTDPNDRLHMAPDRDPPPRS